MHGRRRRAPGRQSRPARGPLGNYVLPRGRAGQDACHNGTGNRHGGDGVLREPAVAAAISLAHDLGRGQWSRSLRRPVGNPLQLVPQVRHW
jgi:hypothetical protein